MYCLYFSSSWLQVWPGVCGGHIILLPFFEHPVFVTLQVKLEGALVQEPEQTEYTHLLVNVPRESMVGA